MRTTSLAAAISVAVSLAIVSPATAPAVAAGETCDGKAATLVVPAVPPGTWQTPPFTGTPGNDVIVGTHLPDTIDGGGGNDTICGLAGDDDLVGGAGDDRIFGGLDGDYSPDDDYYGDRVEPGPGDDHVDLGHDPQGMDLYDVDRGYWDQVSFRNAAGPVTVDLAAGIATGEGTDTIAPIVHAAGIEASVHDDTLLGTVGPDWITAGGGDDHVAGREGGDLIDDGGTGPDVAWVREGLGALVLGGNGRDQLHASGRVRIRGGRHGDLLVPGIETALDEAIVKGGAGHDVLGLDLSLDLAPHRSRLVVGDPLGTVRVPGKGIVVLFGSTEEFAPQSIASSIRLTWFGTRRRDVLDMDMHDGPVRAFARGGRDDLTGGMGRDLLDGGPGRDVIDGSNGRDRCRRGERLTSCEVRR